MSRELKFKMIFDLAQKVTGPMGKISVGAKAMTDDLRKSRTELNALNKTQKQIDGYRKLQSGLRETNQQMDAANKKTAALARTISKADAPTRKLTNEFNRAKKESAALKTKFGAQQRELQELRGSLGAAGISTSNLVADQRKLKSQIGKTNHDIDEQKAKLKSLGDQERKISEARSRKDKTQAKAGSFAIGGAAAIGAGAAIGAPLVGATQEAITFESKMVDIKKVLNDVSPKQLIALEKGLVKMSAQMPISAEGLGQIAAEGARAGIAAKDLLPFTENAARMAAAFDITAEEAGSMMAKWRTGLGLTIPQTAILGDKVNALTNTFGGFAPAVTDMVTRVGPLGKIAGVAGGEMAAMAQLMNSAGVESQIGATGIKRMMLTLNVGAAATDKQAAAFGRLGLDAEKMASTMQTDARGGILSVLDAINQLPKEQQTGALTNLFGSESVASIAPMLSRLDRLKENFQLVGDKTKYAGSMSAEYAVAMSKTENQANATSNALDSAQIVVGQQLIPTYQEALGVVKEMAVGFTEWAQENPKVVKVIGITVGVIAALLIVVGALAIGIGAVMGPFTLLRYSLFLTKTQFAVTKASWIGFRASLTTGKIANAGSALFGLGKKAIGAGKKMLVASGNYTVMAGKFVAGKATAAGSALFGLGKKAIVAGLSFLKAGFMMMMSPIGLVVLAVGALAAGAYLIYKNWDTIGPWFQELWESAKEIFAAAWEGIKSIFFNYTPMGLIYQHWDAITEWFGGLWTNVKSAFSTGWEGIKSIFFNYTPHGLIIKHWDSISAWFGGLWGRVKSAFSTGWQNIKSLASAWPSNMMSIGKNIISGLANGIKSAPGAVYNALKGVVFGGVNKVKGWLGIKSPSRVFMGIGGHVGEGMAIGIDSKGKRTKDSMKRMAAGLTAAAALNLSAPSIAAPKAYQKAETLAGKSVKSHPNRAAQSKGHSGSSVNITNHFHITQAKGEDSEAFAKRIIEMMERKNRDNRNSDYEDDF